MSNEEVLKMALQAGIVPWEKYEFIGGKSMTSTDEGLEGDLACLLQFAELVAAAEREACAQMAEGWTYLPEENFSKAQIVENLGKTIAHYIRARGDRQS